MDRRGAGSKDLNKSWRSQVNKAPFAPNPLLRRSEAGLGFSVTGPLHFRCRRRRWHSSQIRKGKYEPGYSGRGRDVHFDGQFVYGLLAAFQVQDPTASSSRPLTTPETRAGMEADRKNTERQARPGVEEQRKEAEREAEKTLDKDAISAIEETEKAVNAISSNKSDEAVAALERALGKVDVLLARNAKTARIPVNLEANVIDTAPPDHATIMERALDVAAAVDNQDFPAARVLLHGLISEIRIRTYHLPLSTFPIALKEATRLLEEKKNKEANAVLLTAL